MQLQPSCHPCSSIRGGPLPIHPPIHPVHPVHVLQALVEVKTAGGNALLALYEDVAKLTRLVSVKEVEARARLHWTGQLPAGVCTRIAYCTRHAAMRAGCMLPVSPLCIYLPAGWLHAACCRSSL